MGAAAVTGAGGRSVMGPPEGAADLVGGVGAGGTGAPPAGRATAACDAAVAMGERAPGALGRPRGVAIPRGAPIAFSNSPIARSTSPESKKVFGLRGFDTGVTRSPASGISELGPRMRAC